MALIITATHPKQTLLLQSRKHKLWMPPGGHVEPSENPFEAVLRETSEETGFDIREYLPLPTRYDEDRVEVPLPMRMVEVRVTHGGTEHYHIDCMYRVEVPVAFPVKRDETESSGIGWFSFPQLKKLSIPADLQPILKQVLTD